MNESWAVIQGLIVTVLAYGFSQWDIKGKWAPVGTALKGILALLVSFVVAVAGGLFTGAFTWSSVWASLPLTVAVAMSVYGVIIKPLDKAITAAKTGQSSR
jgi:hypothetical protein